MWPKWVRGGEKAEYRVHACEQYQITLWRYGWKKEFIRMVGWVDEHGPGANRQTLPDGDFTQAGVGWNERGFPSPPVIVAPDKSGLYYLWAKTPSGEKFSFPWVVAPARPQQKIALLASTNTWNAYNTPLASSPSGGAFTVDFRNPFDGIVGGGDLDPANPNSADTAISNDGGQTWTLTNPPPVTGAIFGLSYVGQTGGGAGNNLGRAVVVTANDGGAAWTPDEGSTWFTLPSVTGYWAVAFASPKAGWLVGTDGRILKISF